MESALWSSVRAPVYFLIAHKKLTQIIQTESDRRMFAAQLLLVNRQRPFKKRTCLSVLLLLFVQRCQVAQAHRNCGMRLSIGRLCNAQGALEQRTGSNQTSAGLGEQGEIGQTPDNSGMIFPKLLLVNCQRPFKERVSFRVLTCLLERRARLLRL